MGFMPQFPYPVEEPRADDPFYGHFLFPYGMALKNDRTGECTYTVVIHFDGDGHVRLWNCKTREFMVMQTETEPFVGALVLPMDADVNFICEVCHKANDLYATKKICGVCIGKGN